MTYESITDLLADPVLGKLEAMSPLFVDFVKSGGYFAEMTYAALLAVANARGECDFCEHWRPYPVQEAFGPRLGSCAVGVALEMYGDVSAGFGCSLWEARTTVDEGPYDAPVSSDFLP